MVDGQSHAAAGTGFIQDRPQEPSTQDVGALEKKVRSASIHIILAWTPLSVCTLWSVNSEGGEIVLPII